MTRAGPSRAAVVALLVAIVLGLATCGRGGGRTKNRVRHLVHPVVRALEGALESPYERALDLPKELGVVNVYLDAGHGAKDNPGNTSSFCQEEQEFTQKLALDVGEYLESTGHFHVTWSRVATELVPYAERLAEAERSHADVLVSLHSDVRGKGTPYSPYGGRICLENLDAPGFVVLYSDEGPPALVDARRALARSVSTRMGEAGFLRYTGTYDGLYDKDPSDPAVLVDRHEAQKRIFILRRPRMPSIIVETHHALDPREAALWEEDETRRAFAAALAQALADFATRPR